MSRAADSMGESVKTGWLDLRKRAVDAGKAGAGATAQAVEAAEQKLSEGADEVMATGRRARKKLKVGAKQTRKELARSSAAARKEALARLADMRKPGRKAKKAAIRAAKAAGQSKRRGKKDFKSAKKDFRSALIDAKRAAKGERGSRRWPWLLGLGAVAAGAAYALRTKQEPPVAPAPPKATPTKSETAGKTGTPEKTGTSPKPAAEPKPSPAAKAEAETKTKPAAATKPANPRTNQQTSRTASSEKKN